MDFPRSSGIVLHPTSLPAPWGIGDAGPEAYRFVEFLAAAGQRWWQILPLGPTGYGNSPYMCFSAFAGNRLLISPEELVKEGLLAQADLSGAPALPGDRVDYRRVIEFKVPLLARSLERFKAAGLPAHRRGFEEFCQAHSWWLEDYALFRALKEAHGGRPWPEWSEDAAARSPQALQASRRAFADRIEFHKYLQYLFFHQWAALRAYCHGKGIRIIGDMPIYVAHDSADVWAHRELFHLDARGHPLVVAGVPPDYFSATGQRWGNPIYRWDVMARSGYRFWKDRFRANLWLVDVVRLDHFRGFEAYWEISAQEPTAVTGRWVQGPGGDLFDALRWEVGDLPVVAEDLGVITAAVDALRDMFGFPGMRILQMAFGTDPKAAEYRPHHHVSHSVVYTGTHDHNTTVGWFTAEPGRETTQTPEEVAQERAYALKYLGSDGREIHWDFIRMALGSVARLALFPLQDVLGLGSESRMNRPGTAQGNWEWRFRRDALAEGLAQRLRELAGLYDRLHEPSA